MNKLISYSQNGEDIVLSRVLSNVRSGTYLDIGAGDSISDSVTKLFYDNGWRGINVEPDLRLFETLERDRPKDQNLFACVSLEPGDVSFWQATTHGWSTSNSTIANQISELEVISPQTRRGIKLDDLLQSFPSEIHFMKIDCEGDEASIIKTSTFTKKRPWIIIVETIKPRSNESNFAEIKMILLERKYSATFYDGLNHYFVDMNNPELINSDKWYPAGVRDGFRQRQFAVALESSEKFSRETSELLLRIKELESEVLELSTEVENLLTAAGLDKTRLLEARHEKENLETRLLEARHEKENLETRLLEARHEKENLEVKILHSNLEIQGLRQEIQNIESSRIWRSTSKYRRYKSRGKSLFRRLSQAYQNSSNLRHFLAILYKFVRRKLVATLRSMRFFKNNLNLGLNGSLVHYSDLDQNTFNQRQVGSRFGFPHLDLIAATSMKTYILIGASIQTTSNTGVQKVVGSFLEGLLKIDFHPILVKLDLGARSLVKLTESELHLMARNTNLNVDYLISYMKKVPEFLPCDGILLVPEVPYIPTNDPLVCEVLVSYCNSYNLACSAIYYDSIPLFVPGYEYARSAHLSYLKFLSTCLVISCISKDSARELSGLLQKGEYGLPDEQPEICVQKLPVPSSLTSSSAKPISELIGKKYILTVGTVEPRKNQITTIRAYLDLKQSVREIPALVIAGGVRQDVLAWKLENEHRDVIWLGNVSDEEMVWLYQNCEFTVFVSKSEGFGYPVLESAKFGKLCITSKLGSMGEIAMDYPFHQLENVEDVNELKLAILKLLNDPEKLFSNTSSEEDGSDSNWMSYSQSFLNSVQEKIHMKDQRLEVFYWIDHTSQYDGNSGIQRVVRSLAASLLNQGIRLIPVVWNVRDSILEVADEQRLLHLADWSGPEAHLWSLKTDLMQDVEADRLLIVPELTTYSPDEHFLEKILKAAKSLQMQTSVVFFDALPHLMPEIYSPESGLKHRKYMEDLRFADVIIAISNSAKRDLTNFFLHSKRVESEFVVKIFSLPLPSLFTDELIPISDDLNFEGSSDNVTKVLCIGTLELRKNYAALIEAFEIAVASLPKGSIELTILGKGVDFATTELVQDATKRLPISWLGQVSDETLKQNYLACSFTVFPSLGEGFGLPVTESLSFGKPVICGTGGALLENASQGGCLVLDVSDPQAIAEGIIKLASSRETLEQLKFEISNRTFVTWTEYATKALGLSLRFQRRSV
jgi:FkbM family methyltransferase